MIGFLPDGSPSPLMRQPKANVLVYGSMGALVATVSILTLSSGSWRLLALATAALAIVLFVAAFRTLVRARS